MMLLASTGRNRVPVIAPLVLADEDTVRDVIHQPVDRTADVPLRPHARNLTPPPAQSTSEVRIERNGPYIYSFDAGRTDVPVRTETGAWIGVTEDAEAITQLLANYERRQATGSS